jgi:hypothetical protein
MLCRDPAIPFSSKALLANLLRLQNEWETVQASRDRAAIYGYLAAVFETVMVWAKEGKAVKRAYRALHLRGYSSLREPAPFAALILCTSDPNKSMAGHEANGRGCCGARRNTRIWMCRCGIS